MRVPEVMAGPHVPPPVPRRSVRKKHVYVEFTVLIRLAAEIRVGHFKIIAGDLNQCLWRRICDMTTLCQPTQYTYMYIKYVYIDVFYSLFRCFEI